MFGLHRTSSTSRCNASGHPAVGVGFAAFACPDESCRDTNSLRESAILSEERCEQQPRQKTYVRKLMNSWPFLQSPNFLSTAAYGAEARERRQPNTAAHLVAIHGARHFHMQAQPTPNCCLHEHSKQLLSFYLHAGCLLRPSNRSYTNAG